MVIVWGGLWHWWMGIKGGTVIHQRQDWNQGSLGGSQGSLQSVFSQDTTPRAGWHPSFNPRAPPWRAVPIILLKVESLWSYFLYSALYFAAALMSRDLMLPIYTLFIPLFISLTRIYSLWGRGLVLIHISPHLLYPEMYCNGLKEGYECLRCLIHQTFTEHPFMLDTIPVLEIGR